MTAHSASSGDPFRLDGRVALITGGSKGIGAATAHVLAAGGADVAIVARNEADLNVTARDVEGHGQRCLALPADVRDPDAMVSVVNRTVAELGGLDVLVLNAGGSIPRSLMDTSPESLEKSLNFNVVAPLHLTQLCVPHLRERPGSAIVMVGSMAGIHANRNMTAHSVANAARAQLTRTMAADLAPSIRVNAVLPGAIETDALRGHLDSMSADVRDRMHARTALGRNGTADDVAHVVRFLASPASGFMTGTLVPVEGGASSDLFGR